MNIEDIQKRLNVIPAAMAAKGLRLPDAQIWLRANMDLTAHLSWNVGATNRYSDEKSEYFRVATAEEAIEKIEAYVASLPSAEETKRNTFLAALGKVIDLGNELGQDVGALAVEMKRLASNAITHQPAE